ncbi:MAG: exodeoxyribonuclease VII large subunit [Nitrospiraceae bacterium]|nr:exodeoxyribonuclease VII large subunit [Nitrospiraceae bacterium]
MTEPLIDQRAITLSELNNRIKSALNYFFPGACWVIAEIADSRCDQKGHCYLTLIEKTDDRTVAQAKANIWSYEYRKLMQKFEKSTGETLKAGMKVLFLAAVNFHEVYGLSLNIRDIDPIYTMGEMARKRKEVLDRLQKEGLLDRNKALKLPLGPQRIAIISSPGAAGYGDFMNHITNNAFGYRFQCTLFQAIMQGPTAEKSIISALREVQAHRDSFDVVIIIRGGGSQVDLHCFDGYDIAAAVATCVLPVLTGIGHERDDTVVDMVAHTRLKTPTATAEFLISGLRAFEERILEVQRKLVRYCDRALRDERHSLDSLLQRLQRAAMNVLQKEDSKLAIFEKTVRHLDPESLLKRGYSITFLNGKVLKSISEAEVGTLVITQLHDGTVQSKIEEVKNG